MVEVRSFCTLAAVIGYGGGVVGMLHKNLCDYAADKAALYQLWDNDLKKMMYRRQFCEVVGMLCFLGSCFAWRMGNEAYLVSGIWFGILFMFMAVKFMIDESNINYLMHQWDLQNAFEYFRRVEDEERGETRYHE
jgi:hypothetical protein